MDGNDQQGGGPADDTQNQGNQPGGDWQNGGNVAEETPAAEGTEPTPAPVEEGEHQEAPAQEDNGGAAGDQGGTAWTPEGSDNGGNGDNGGGTPTA